MDRYGVVGPSLAAIRRIRGETTEVPLYPNLVDDLCKVERYAYDPIAAHVCAVLCGWAYADAEVVATMMVRLGLERNRCRYIGLINDAMLISSKVYYVQSRCGKVGLLAYRGTEPFNLSSWATDANVAPIAIPVDPPAAGESKRVQVVQRGKSLDKRPLVHGGFYVNQRATWFEVQSTLVDALRGQSVLHDIAVKNPSPVDGGDGEDGKDLSQLEALFVTGHSLGGAMAAIAAFRLAHDRKAPEAADLVKRIRGVYTFGQPMIGNEAWASMLTDDEGRYALLTKGLFRHVFGCDPVPSLPPHEAGSFVHTGVEYRTALPPGDHPTWQRQPPGVRRGAMPASQLPLSFLAFVNRQLPGFDILDGGTLPLPPVTVQSLDVLRGSLVQRLPQALVKTAVLPALTPLVAKIDVEIPPLEADFNIYDHLPANYVVCSTPPDKLNEFGDF
jgi:hypothetical protein